MRFGVGLGVGLRFGCDPSPNLTLTGWPRRVQAAEVQVAAAAAEVAAARQEAADGRAEAAAAWEVGLMDYS